jgi:hypothetical protein
MRRLTLVSVCLVSACAVARTPVTRADPCIFGELADVAEAVGAEFGEFTLSGGRSVWCDLPSVQAREEGRRVWVPLGTAFEWSGCSEDTATMTSECGEVPAGWLGASWEPWEWVCGSGEVSQAGWAVDWTCDGTDWEGSPDHRVVGAWRMDPDEADALALGLGLLGAEL